ncbi:unnamed protein product [Linum tenue]|uniref:Uncharacterized protein n=1 Tax=Linum tenue TaxID=586396 RepID=A0AAV0GTU0_9ROSI|nr:unnamed protein product [Linum tenue]
MVVIIPLFPSMKNEQKLKKAKLREKPCIYQFVSIRFFGQHLYENHVNHVNFGIKFYENHVNFGIKFYENS